MSLTLCLCSSSDYVEPTPVQPTPVPEMPPAEPENKGNKLLHVSIASTQRSVQSPHSLYVWGGRQRLNKKIVIRIIQYNIQYNVIQCNII